MFGLVTRCGFRRLHPECRHRPVPVEQAQDQRGGLRAALPSANLNELWNVEGDVVAAGKSQPHNTQAI